MATLLSLCQNVLRETGFPVPTSIISNASPDARRLFALTQTAGDSLARLHDWPRLTFAASVSVSSATAIYSLPSDFYEIVPNTVYIGSDEVNGPIGPQDWTYLKNIDPDAALGDRWRVRRATTSATTVSLIVDPAPSSTEVWTFEYRSHNWILAADGTPKRSWTVDTDTTILDDHLMYLNIRWRWLKAKGQAYAEEKKEFDDVLKVELHRDDGGASKLNLTGMV